MRQLFFPDDLSGIVFCSGGLFLAALTMTHGDGLQSSTVMVLLLQMVRSGNHSDFFFSSSPRDETALKHGRCSTDLGNHRGVCQT